MKSSRETPKARQIVIPAKAGIHVRRQHGFTYLTVMAVVAASGFGLAAVAEAWSTARQREKEEELLWVGEQFRQAIATYYYRSPGSVKTYPKRLEDLVEDRRFLSVQRHLRRIYIDPLTGNTQWGIVASPDGSIAGIHSLASAIPLRQGNFSIQQSRLAGARSYGEWRFVFEPIEAHRH
jgi:type II secretory pathway pseudopilin PulG